MSKLVAHIVPKDRLDESIPVCQVCMTLLIGEHGGESNLKYGLCLEHLTRVLGENRQESTALLLARGVVMVCWYSNPQVYKMRVEVRSSRRSELLMLQRDLEAGRIYKHSASISRWSCSALADLHKIGSVVMPFIPAIGIFLQSYVVQPDRKTRSAYAEAFLQKVGSRTTHLVSYL